MPTNRRPLDLAKQKERRRRIADAKAMKSIELEWWSVKAREPIYWILPPQSCDPRFGNPK